MTLSQEKGVAGSLRVEPILALSHPGRITTLPDSASSFRDQFAVLFNEEFPRAFRYLDRVSGDPDLAADLAQESFVRLYRRGAMPDEPRVWLLTVAMNLFRNTMSSRSRHARLLTEARAQSSLSDPSPSASEVREAHEVRDHVRATLDGMPERDRHLLLLRAEGYSYRELAAALGLHEASVGTLLARARAAFRASYQEPLDAR